MSILGFVRSNSGAAAILAAIVLIGLSISIVSDQYLMRLKRQADVENLQMDALRIAGEIQRKLAFLNILTQTVADAVELEPRINQTEFSETVEPFMRADSTIINVAVAWGTTVRLVHPYEHNIGVIGLDYQTVPDQYASVQRAIKKGTVTFSGPIDLVQGIRGFIHRAPIHLEDESGLRKVVGVVSVVSSERDFLEFVEQIKTQELRAAIRVVHSSSNSGQVLWGTADVFQDSPILIEFEVYDQVWELAIAPREGWTAGSPWRTVALLFYLLGTLSVAVLFVGTRRILSSRQRALEHLFAAIESIDDGFALYDPQDRLVMCNSRYKSYYKASAHLMTIGAQFEDIIRHGVALGQYRDAVGQEEAWIDHQLAWHRNPKGSMELLLDDGRWLKVSEARMADGSTVGFRVDVTELKLAQQAAEKASLAKTEFLNSVSHEIRTPLSAIIGFSTILLKAQHLPERLRLAKSVEDGDIVRTREALASYDALICDFARRIDANGKHLLGIINDILYWNRNTLSEEPDVAQPVKVASVVDAVVDQLSDLARGKGIALSVESSDGHVLAEDIRLQQVFMNLVGNALKFTDEGSVRIETEERDGWVHIRVSDTGCGIPCASLVEVFEPFKQLDSGITRRHGGLGLGLAISREIIERIGGSIEVSSEVGVGSIFTVKLPSSHANAIAA